MRNNGGKTDYYKINPKWKMVQDIIETRNMNFSQGNILKAAFCFNTERHSGTDYERELNKIIWFCKREKKRINKLKKIDCNSNKLVDTNTTKVEKENTNKLVKTNSKKLKKTAELITDELLLD